MKQTNKVKRFISLILSLAMFLTLTAGLDLSVYAAIDFLPPSEPVFEQMPKGNNVGIIVRPNVRIDTKYAVKKSETTASNLIKQVDTTTLSNYYAFTPEKTGRYKINIESKPVYFGYDKATYDMLSNLTEEERLEGAKKYSDSNVGLYQSDMKTKISADDAIDSATISSVNGKAAFVDEATTTSLDTHTSKYVTSWRYDPIKKDVVANNTYTETVRGVDAEVVESFLVAGRTYYFQVTLPEELLITTEDVKNSDGNTYVHVVRSPANPSAVVTISSLDEVVRTQFIDDIQKIEVPFDFPGGYYDARSGKYYVENNITIPEKSVIYSGTDKSYVVRDTIDGVKVVRFFNNSNTLTSLTLGRNISDVVGCDTKNLTTIKITNPNMEVSAGMFNENATIFAPENSIALYTANMEGYNIHTHEYAKTVVAPNGAKPGYTKYNCTGCDDGFSTDFTYNSLVLDTKFHVETDDEYGWLSFTPTEDGTYIIESSDYTNDPYVELYDENMDFLSANDDGGERWNFKLSYELEAGKTYYYWFGYRNDSYDVVLKKLKDSDIPVSVEFIRNNDYEYIENSYGYYWKNGSVLFENNGMCVFEGDVIKVTYKDGTIRNYYYHIKDIGGDGRFDSQDGESLSWKDCRFGVYGDDWWDEITALGVNYVTLKVGELYCEFPITVIENPIESISFTSDSPKTCIENVSGYWEYVSDDNEEQYFCYYIPFQDGDVLTVNYKDGTSVEYKYSEEQGFVDDEGNWIEPIVQSEQWQNPWKKGKDNYFYIEYMGSTCKVPVEIIENPYESIEFTPVREKVLIVNDEGYWETDENEDEYFDYQYNHYEIGDVLTVYYKDGTSIDYTYQCLDEKEEYCDFADEDGNILNNVNSCDNQYEEHWTVDSDNYYYIEYLGMAVSVPVTIVESPVESISYIPNESPVLIEELSFGGYGPFWGGLSLSEEDDERYYEYFQACFGVFKPGNKIIVNYKDGTQKVATCGSEVFSYTFGDGEELDIRIYSDQYEKHWTLGDDNYFELRYMGASCDVQVTIVENPYNKATLSGVDSSLKIQNEPYYDEYMGYDIYDVDYGELQNIKITLSGIGIEKKTLNAQYDEYGLHFYDENGEMFNAITTESQWYAPWVKGGENYITISVGKFSVDIPVEISDEVEEHAHSYTEINSQFPTCTEEGYVVYKCEYCNVSVTEYLDALGHNYKFTEYYDGIFYYQCEDCEKENKKLYSRLPDFNEEFAQKVIRGKGSMYLDFNNDDYVNAKDYLVLRDIMA